VLLHPLTFVSFVLIIIFRLLNSESFPNPDTFIATVYP